MPPEGANIVGDLMSAKITGNEPTVAVPLTPSGPNVPPAASSDPIVSRTPSHHVFAGRYEILSLLGAGGMGTVYKVLDKKLDEIVALKMLQRSVVDQPGMLDRFRQEVKLARRVTHRNVARTFDIGEHDGENFLTMEFIEGESLAAKLARERMIGRDFGMTLIVEGCAGLEAAHAAGIVHRDLKPDNILVATDGRIVITDFGIARAVSSAGAGLTVGMALGTPTYMAPEQVEGRRDLDARADVYAFGAILYECITGEPAWTGDSVWAVAAGRLTRPPPDPCLKRPELPRVIGDLVMKCMARDREQRFASAREVSAAFESAHLPTRGLQLPVRAGLPEAPADGAKAVAVLPFRNNGPSEDAYLADALSDDLIDALSMTPGLRVVSRGSVERFREGNHDAREVGRDLRVQVVVEGSLRRAGGQLRVSARLVHVVDGFQLWARRFDRPEAEALAISDEAAGAIAEALAVRRAAAARGSGADPRATDLYLRARQLFHRSSHKEVVKAVDLFEEALKIAPEDPMILGAHARALVRIFMVEAEQRNADELASKVREVAERALAIAPNLPEPRSALAYLKWLVGDATGCARDLREALRLAPSTLELNELCGRILIELGEIDRGVARLRGALAFEPNLGLARVDVARGLLLKDDWSSFDAIVEGFLSGDGDSLPSLLFITRFSMWRRDARVVPVVRARRPAFLRPQLLVLLDILETGAMTREVAETLSTLDATSHSRRFKAFLNQMATEAFAFVGDEERGKASLGRSDACALLDLAWMDRCPLLAAWRDRDWFLDVRGHVAARAREALDVLDGRVA